MSSTPVASAKEIAEHGWTAVPRDPKVFLEGKPYVNKPLALTLENIPFPANDPIVSQVHEYAKKNLSEPAYNHSMRVYYFGESESAQ